MPCCARTCVYMYMSVFVPITPNYVGTTVHGVCNVLWYDYFGLIFLLYVHCVRVL